MTASYSVCTARHGIGERRHIDQVYKKSKHFKSFIECRIFVHLSLGHTYINSLPLMSGTHTKKIYIYIKLNKTNK